MRDLSPLKSAKHEKSGTIYHIYGVFNYQSSTLLTEGAWLVLHGAVNPDDRFAVHAEQLRDARGVVGGELQMSTMGVSLSHGDQLVLYRSAAGGAWWWRMVKEFKEKFRM